MRDSVEIALTFLLLNTRDIPINSKRLVSTAELKMRFTISQNWERLKMNKIYKQVERFKNEIK